MITIYQYLLSKFGLGTALLTPQVVRSIMPSLLFAVFECRVRKRGVTMHKLPRCPKCKVQIVLHSRRVRRSAAVPLWLAACRLIAFIALCSRPPSIPPSLATYRSCERILRFLILTSLAVFVCFKGQRVGPFQCKEDGGFSSRSFGQIKIVSVIK